MKILLLEDDIILNEIIEENLLEAGFEVISCEDGYEAEALIYESQFDLLLLDVHVPNLNGFELLESLREKQINTPAIFITSLNTSNDMEEGFKCGADDYIKKPFEIKELLLRIKNIKRIYHIEESTSIKLSSNIAFDTNKNLIINSENRYSLTKKESQILQYLLNHPNQNISMDELITNVWDYDQIPSDATIRTYIKKIRKYIGEEFISNIKGVGYRFNKI
jgi:DNA-binding response OmpR family regulator